MTVKKKKERKLVCTKTKSFGSDETVDDDPDDDLCVARFVGVFEREQNNAMVVSRCATVTALLK
jgi:hypothetical protein